MNKKYFMKDKKYKTLILNSSKLNKKTSLHYNNLYKEKR